MRIKYYLMRLQELSTMFMEPYIRVKNLDHKLMILRQFEVKTLSLI